MDTWTIIGCFIGGTAFFGLGLFAVIVSIKGLLSKEEPDVRMRINNSGGIQVGRPGLVVLTIIGAAAVVGGIALLIWGIRLVG